MKSPLVAVFADRQGAHEVARTLRDESFYEIWIGVILPDASLKSENTSLGARVGRLFKGDVDGRTLAETLQRHGVSPAETQRIERKLEPDDVVLTVDGSNHPELAARIIEDGGGNIICCGLELLGYADPAEFARGRRIDDGALTRLRNQRLMSDTIPTIRENIFVTSYDLTP